MGKTALDEMSKDGAFKRTDSTFRIPSSSNFEVEGYTSLCSFPGQISLQNAISKDSKEFPPSAGRYHLYIAYGCPWANRCLDFLHCYLNLVFIKAVLHIKGLQDAIGVSIVHPSWARTRPDDDADLHCGWQFVDPATTPTVPSVQGLGALSTEGCVPDTVNNARFVRDLYLMADPTDANPKYTVPILWDKESKTIVNNESSEIMRLLNREFNAFAKNPAVDLCPEALLPTIDACNEWTYGINNGVYKCGFATSQQAYDEAEAQLFDLMERAETLLSKQRYLAGGSMTEADIRLFVTLVRFDEVYVVYFKTNRKCLREFPNLFNYTKDVYQFPGVAETVNMQHIKMHYFTSHPKLNSYAIIPRGPGVDFLSVHDRDRFN